MIGLLLLLFSIFQFGFRKKRWQSILCLVALVTGGFQLLPMSLLVFPALGVTKSWDWAALFVVIILGFYPDAYVKNMRKALRLLPGLIYWLLVLIIVLCYNIFFVDVEIVILIRVLRLYLFIIAFVPFIDLSYQDYQKTLRYIVILTTCASGVYILQPIVGLPLLNAIGGDTSAVTIIRTGVFLRFYNSPPYLIPVILMFFLMYKELTFSSKERFFYLGVNLLAVIVTQHRNLMVILILLYFISYAQQKKLSTSLILVFVIGGILAILGVATVVGGRLEEGVLDVMGVFGRDYGQNAQKTLILEHASTLDFRLFHFLERFRYISNDLGKTLCGIGLINEEARLVKTLGFRIGLTNTKGDAVSQIDTGDIYWSLVIVHTGVLGLIAYTQMLLRSIIFYFRQSENKIARLIFLYLLQLLFTSFFGVELYTAYTYVLLVVLIGFNAKHMKLIQESRQVILQPELSITNIDSDEKNNSNNILI